MKRLGQQFASLVLQPVPERDPGFRRDLDRGSELSLRIVGLLEMVVPLVMMAAGVPLLPVPADVRHATAANVAFVALGALTSTVAATPAGRRWPRLFTLLSIWASVAIMLCGALWIGAPMEWMPHHLRGYIVLVLFGAAAGVPIRPVQGLGLGLAIYALLVAARLGWPQRFFTVGLTLRPGEQFFLLILSLLCMLMAASVYRQRYVGYRNHQRALRASEELRHAENKLLISENAAMMGRVAAALSHELNSPIGALVSSVDILGQVARKMAGAKEADKARLLDIMAEAVISGQKSGERLRGIVGRMQRFTNLDRAEVQSADLNELLRDVIAMASADRTGDIPIHTDLGEVPRLSCRPQQISALFSNLIHNALDAVGVDGEVRVVTAVVKSAVEVRVQDNGRGLDEEQLRTLFDPAAFRDAQGRVKAGNWSLFSCRQIAEEHGGTIEVSSRPGETVFVVRFPL